MALGILVYCDDSYLSEHLKELLRNEQRTFSVFHFTDTEKAERYLSTNASKIKCVMSSQDLLDEIGTNDVVKVQIGEETIFAPQKEKLYTVNVYQKKDSILNDLLTILRREGMIAQSQQNAGATTIISFFSTQGGSGRTTLAYLTAVRSASDAKTAYLCFDTAPCVDPLYKSMPSESGEEFLFALQERADSSQILAAFSQTEHGVYVLPALASLQDRALLTADDVEYLLNVLSDSGLVQSVVVDLSNTLGPVERYVLSSSDRVAIVYSDDRMGAAKRQQLENDPNYTTYPFAGRELWIGNRCRAEYRDGRFDVCFPISNSLGSVDDLKAVLAGNPAFAAGCDSIIEIN